MDREENDRRFGIHPLLSDLDGKQMYELRRIVGGLDLLGRERRRAVNDYCIHA